jgi:hypothetical protein
MTSGDMNTAINFVLNVLDIMISGPRLCAHSRRQYEHICMPLCRLPTGNAPPLMGFSETSVLTYFIVDHHPFVLFINDSTSDTLGT